jgi:phosphohistidine phosphatase
MKTLILVRHAKSSWDDPTLSDQHRPLNDRGKRNASKMGKRLTKRDVKVDLILSSPAKRAIKTAWLLADELDYKHKDIVVDARLYPGTVNELRNVIYNLGKKLHRVMVISHHPALSMLARRFAADIAHMPTCAVAEFKFNAATWPDVRKATLRTASLDLPKIRGKPLILRAS